MKTNCLTLVVVLCLVSLAVMSKSFASAADSINEAPAVARTFLALVDAGEYDESYQSTCTALQAKVPQSKWTIVLRALRPKMGENLSRKEISHVFKPDGVEGLPGECVIVSYDSSFKNLAAASEVVVLKWEDGKWRTAGYNFGPKATDQAADQDDNSSQTSSTTTSTTVSQPQVNK